MHNDIFERQCYKLQTIVFALFSLEILSVRSASKLVLAEKEEAHEENGVLFWINKSGFPIDDHTWDRMWEHASKIHPQGHDIVCNIRHRSDLPQVLV